jgi:hypothetical protein
MELTYEVNASNNSMPKITFEVKGLSKNVALFIAKNLSLGFCDVAVVCEMTGELVYNISYSTDFNKPSLSEVEALRSVQKILAND